MWSDSNLLRWAGGLGAPIEQFGVRVKIDNHLESKIYTCGVPISGVVIITPKQDTTFDTVDITLNGKSCILADYLQPHAVRSSQAFLRLKMPIDAAFLPTSNVFLANKIYHVPFNFVIPHQLPVGACNYKCSSEVLRDHHLRPPPTVGSWEADDLAPGLTKIKYSIDARVFKDGTREPLMETSQEIKVLPSLPEDAPLDVTADDTLYCLSQTKEVRKGIMSGKTGYIRATASQPKPIVLTHDALASSTSLLSVDLEFIPTSNDASPPSLHSASATLESYTYYSLTHIESMPNLGSPNPNQPIPIRLYNATESLPHKTRQKLAWERIQYSRKSSESRSSSQSDRTATTDGDGDSQRYGARENSLSCYATTYDIDLKLPLSAKKVFLPTFHSCMASRVYFVSLVLTLGPQNTTVSLSIPVQITVENCARIDVDELPQYSHFEDELDQECMEHAILPAYGKYI